MFDGLAANIRRHVPALVMMPESGWFTSCAIDAVNTPRLVTLVAWARSDRAWVSASSASRRSVYILNRTDVLQTAILVWSPVSYQVQVLDGLVRHQKAVLVLKIAGGALRPLDHMPKEGDVFRMDSTTDPFKRYEPTRFELEDAIELIRPRDLSTLDAPGKAAQASEALALGNKRLTTPQLFRCPFRSSIRCLFRTI